MELYHSTKFKLINLFLDKSLEAWGLLGARLARVECITNENQSLELDSGDWFLVRVKGLHDESLANGIVRLRRQSIS